MAIYFGWAVRSVESNASTPRFQVGTLSRAPEYDYPANFVAEGEAERAIFEARRWESERDSRWEFGSYLDRDEAGLALFRKGLSERVVDRMLSDAASGKTARLMLGSDEIEVV